MAQKGHRVTVLTSLAITGRGWVDPIWGTYASKREEIINGVRVKRLPTRWPITAFMHISRKVIGGLPSKPLRHFVSLLSAGPYLSHLKEELRAERYDVVHVTPLPFAIVWQVQRACRALKKPYICSPLIHFEDPRYDNPFLWKALQDAAGVIACSNYEREKIEERGILHSKIDMIPMGIDTGKWKDGGGEGFRRRYGLQGKKIILFAGTKGYNKGAIDLLHAAEELSRRRQDWILVAIGLPTKEWKTGKQILPESHLLDPGYVSEEEKREVFAACDLFVMPSRHDSFGIVYLEAWQCGRPVIGARVGAIPEVIEDGEDGLLVEFGNVRQLAVAIDDLLSHPDRCREMGERGRKKVLERFDWQKNVEKMEKVYRGARAAW